MFGDVERLHHCLRCCVVKCPYALDFGSVYCVGQVGFIVVVPYYIGCYDSIYRWPFGSPDLHVKY